MSAALALVAMLVELCFGYPERLLHAAGHPVSWVGRLIGALDRSLNRETMTPAARRAAGVVAIVIVVTITGLAAFVVEDALLRLPLGTVAAGVSRAAIESLAENFSDAVVAPVLWMVIAGLPGGAVYKAINTADSMIGHRTPRHAAFGWAAARLDDLVNLPASRLTALFLVIAAWLGDDTSPAAAWRAVRRDAPRHRSPNAGYPEAAMAGALGLSLAGPRSYGGVPVKDAAMGDGRRNADAADIRRALALFRAADALLIALLAVVAAFLIAPG
jgi:adenosylcobinamide-phosphate synthase